MQIIRPADEVYEAGAADFAAAVDRIQAIALDVLCKALYETAGADAVCRFIKEFKPEVAWAYCDGCENDYPEDDGVCLVCGSAT